MSQNVQGCIFDLDGVIVDTAKYHYLAWRRLAQELGFDFSEAQNERLKGVSRVRSLEILLEIGGISLSPDEQEAARERKNRWYVQYIDQMDVDELLPGIGDFIDELRAKKIPLALGSASKNARRILERIRLTAAFDSIVDGTKVSRAKPDPEVFLLAASELSVPPAHCVVFEDAAAGIEAGLRAGMFTIGVGDPSNLGSAHKVIPGFAGFTVSDLKACLQQPCR